MKKFSRSWYRWIAGMDKAFLGCVSGGGRTDCATSRTTDHTSQRRITKFIFYVRLKGCETCKRCNFEMKEGGIWRPSTKPSVWPVSPW